MHDYFFTRKKYLHLVIISFFILLLLVVQIGSAHAQSSRAVQVFEDRLAQGERHLYLLSDMKKGDMLYAYMQNKSGNLDPGLALADDRLGITALAEAYNKRLDETTAEGRDPLEAIPAISSELFLVWDDDSGKGYDAALSYEIPADGDYLLLATRSPGYDTSGDYRLTIGLNSPKILEEDVKPTGEPFAALHLEASQAGFAIQEVTGTLTADRSSTFFTLKTIDANDTLYVYAEATSGDLIPVLTLKDFGGKPIRSGNLYTRQPNASLSYEFDEKETNFTLHIESCCEGEALTEGDYRLLVGINSPEVLEGERKTSGEPIIQEPIPVHIGVKIDQITDVDQQAENYSAVVDLRFEWQDPSLAFSPDDCGCKFKTFTQNGFGDFIKLTEGKWPDFTLFNQQGNRWTQNKVVVVHPDGNAIYYERFTTTFQAPDFNFTTFPFDTQDFYLRVRALYPEEFMFYSELAEHTGMGEQLGEEEWIVKGSNAEVSTVDKSSQFNFHFVAARYLTFYVTRIFIPLILIIIVAWITFFLKDYGKRVDATAANLLLFIAFNFTISDDLPRLGYMTFLDWLLMSTFAISVLVVAYNVVLKRLELAGEIETAIKVDKYTVWIYPLVYLAAFGLVTIVTFWL